MARGTLGAHLSSFGGGGGVGAGSGDGWRQDSGGTAATARIPMHCMAELSHGWLWELEWRLGSSLESLVGHGHKRRRELTSGVNGGRRWTGATAGAREGKEGGFIGSTTRRGGFARALCPQGIGMGTGAVGNVRWGFGQ
jgi:hypothetical protein